MLSRRLTLGFVGAAIVTAGVGVMTARTRPVDPTVVLQGDLSPVVEAAPADAPNILVVMGCTVRRDQVGAYGGPSGLTPFLDSMATEGTLVTDPIAAGPWTRVASAALLTGRHAISLGMVEPGPLRNDRALPQEATTLAEYLRAYGWRTVGFTANPNLNAVFGFHQGFEDYKQLPSLWREVDVKLSTRRALDGLLELAAADDGRPVYLQAMLIDAHAPYVSKPAQGRRWHAPGAPPVVGEYRAALHRFDAAVAELWDGLRGLGWSTDNTVVFVVSDHGEGLSWPAHHGKGHGRHVSPSAVHGVWVAWGAGIASGHRVDGVASQIDMVPTVLGLIGRPDGSLPGMDLSAALAGHSSQTGRAAAFTDTWFLDSSRAGVYTRDRMCQRDFGPDPGIFVDGCFDRLHDPQHEDVISVPGLERRLLAWRRDRAHERAEWDTEVTTTPEGLAAQLQALGYTSGPESTEEGEE